jgi:protein ImuA
LPISLHPLERLRARVRAIEGGGRALGREVARLGPALDRALPWGGLPVAALHEVGGAAGGTVAAGFARRFLECKGALVWCRSDRLARQQGELYGPGLRAYGIDHARLLHVRARDERDSLWAAAEALRSPAVACTVVELDSLDLGSSRRLQLAAEAGGGAGILLRTGPLDTAPNAALTRFWAEPRLGRDFTAEIRLTLWRAKGAPPAFWMVTWNEETLAFDLVAGLANRADGRGRAATG